MATPTMAIQQIFRARREERQAPSVRRYRPAYRAILEAVYDIGGGDLVDDIAAWIIAEAERSGELPEPKAVRATAERLIADSGFDVPPASDFKP